MVVHDVIVWEWGMVVGAEDLFRPFRARHTGGIST